VCSSPSVTSAPHSASYRVGSMLVRSWPLAGFRLSHRRVRAALSVYWPWPPSLVDRCRLGTPFGALAVLRGHPTPAVPSPPRPFVLGDYQRCPPGGRQVSPGKGQKVSHEPVTNTCGRPADFGLCDWRPAYPRLTCLTVLRLRSVPCCTYDFHQTVPRGPALVFCVGFPLPRFQKDSHLLLSARAGRNPKSSLRCGWGRLTGSVIAKPRPMVVKQLATSWRARCRLDSIECPRHSLSQRWVAVRHSSESLPA
jgi:hypothetical protein